MIASSNPIEFCRNDQPEQADNSIDKSNNQFNDLRFDIDGPIESIPDDVGFMDLGGMAEDDFESLTEDDQHALKACRGLRRPTNVITDMTPDDALSNLEYSYRSLTEKFTRFWAGPSYWKFKVNRGASSNAVRAVVDKAKKKTFKNKEGPVEIEEEANEAAFVSVDGRPAAKLRKANIYNRWDGRRTKLPRDFKQDRTRFLRYSFAPGLAFANPSISSPQTFESDINDDDDNGMDMGSDNFGMVRSGMIILFLFLLTKLPKISFSLDQDHHNIQDDSDHQMNNDVLHDRTNVTVTEIGAEFHGAPEQVS